MAATTHEHWVYPPGFIPGDYTKHYPRRYCILLQGKATATEDETAVRKIVLADLWTQKGETPTKMVIDRIAFECRGFTAIELYWERTDDHTLTYIGGANAGVQDFSHLGGFIDHRDGKTGDLMLTTTGGSANDTYSFKIEFRVK